MKLSTPSMSVICRRWYLRLALPAFMLLPALHATWAQQIVVVPPSITKSFSAASVPLNTSVTLTFTIVNPNGAVDLTGVSFNDNLPGGLIIANPSSLTGTCDPGVITPAVTSINLVGGTILAGSSCTFSVDVLAISGGTQVNTTDPVTSNEGGTGNTATATVDVPLPDLAIAKSHSGNFRQGQAGAAYTITVTNVGGATTNAAVTVTDTLPAGLTATGISGTGWACSAPPTLTCTCSSGLDPGLSFPDITLTVNVAANAPPAVTNTAIVSGGAEANASNDTATNPTIVDQVADLTISKTHAGDFARGQTGATYTLTVHNAGLGPTVGTVSVTDTLPVVPNTFVATAIGGTGWTCNLGTLTCTRSDALASGGNYPAITLTTNVPATIQANVTNTAAVSGGGELNTANDSTSDPTHIGAPIQLTPQFTDLQVNAGGAVSTTVNVDSSTGVGTITFSCTGLPAGASCEFSPSSASGLASQVTLTIITARSSSSLPPPGPGKVMPAYVLTLLSLLGLLALAMARNQSKRFRIRLAAGLAGVLLLTLAGCGSNSGLSNKGKFPVSINATSTGGASGSASVSLTVL